MAQKTKILTPEQVTIEFDIAGIGARAAGMLIDSLIHYFLLLLVVLALIGLRLTSTLEILDVFSFLDNWLFAGLILVLFVIYQGYFLYFEIVWNGQTPGKKVVGIRVVMDDGRPVTAGAVVIRNLLRLVDAFPLPPLYFIGVISAFINTDAKRLGDMAAGTLVVKQGKKAEPVEGVTEALENTPGLDLAVQQAVLQLTPAEVQAIRQTLERLPQLTPEVGRKLAEDIALKVAIKVKVAPASLGMTAMGFLQEVLRVIDTRRRV